MRRLKKADFEVDFFFMNEVELFPSPVNPEMVAEILGEMLRACQCFFLNVSLCSLTVHKGKSPKK